MIVVGWICFLGSWLFNIAYYILHPSHVFFSIKTIISEKKLYVCGKECYVLKYKRRIGGIEGKGKGIYDCVSHLLLIV